VEAQDVDQLLDIRTSIAATWQTGPGRDIAVRAIYDLLRRPPDSTFDTGRDVALAPMRAARA
jgi:hypothetical protein